MSLIDKIGLNSLFKNKSELSPILIIGLGNPGLQFKKTKHNFGFLVIDQIIKDYNLSLDSKNNFYEVFLGSIKKNKIIVLKPMKYMNLSGLPTLKIKTFYKIDINNIMVFHDDLDIELGKIKIKIGGGSAGHNGLKDIDKNIGNNYFRVRLGIGRPQNSGFDISDYVLSKFTEEERDVVDSVGVNISNLLDLLIDKKRNEFISEFNKSVR